VIFVSPFFDVIVSHKSRENKIATDPDINKGLSDVDEEHQHDVCEKNG